MAANKYKVMGISFSGYEKLLAEAKARSKSQRRSFSNYVVGLIKSDLEKGGIQYPTPGGQAAALADAPEASERTTATLAKIGAAKVLPEAEAAQSGASGHSHKVALPSGKTAVPGVRGPRRRDRQQTPLNPVPK